MCVRACVRVSEGLVVRAGLAVLGPNACLAVEGGKSPAYILAVMGQGTWGERKGEDGPVDVHSNVARTEI